MTTGYVPFVVLFLGRSGSTWLIDRLASHTAVIAKGEALIALAKVGGVGQNAWARDFLTRERIPICRAVGFKTKLTDVLDPHGFARMLRQIRCRVIVLERENLARQAISWIRGDLLHERHLVHNITRSEQRLAATAIDPDMFIKRLGQLKQGRSALRRYVADLDLPLCRLTYEAQLADPNGCDHRIQLFLDLEPQPLQSGYIKHTADDLDMDVENIDILRSRLAGSEWAGLLDRAPVAVTGPAS